MTSSIWQDSSDPSQIGGAGDQTASTGGSLLPELPPSRWRSLGKRLDYNNWEARDRFVELDAAILLRQELEYHRTPVGSASNGMNNGAAQKQEHSFRSAA